jgi:hypothetical protein
MEFSNELLLGMVDQVEPDLGDIQVNRNQRRH